MFVMKQNHILHCTHNTTNDNLEQFSINKQWLADDLVAKKQQHVINTPQTVCDLYDYL